MRQRGIFIVVAILVVLGIAGGALYYKNSLPGSADPDAAATPVATDSPGVPAPVVSGSPTPVPSPTGSPLPDTSALQKTNLTPDLTADPSGLSKATVIIRTAQGVIKYKFYPTDAPNTVKRIVELINQGFYNGLSFHRVVPGFVVQGGDPVGNGTGGSGKSLKAEFNSRKHIEGSVAMARAGDPDSADSQFYICLAPQPHLDHSYTVFGQVVEGMDVVRKIQPGDKMTSVIIE